MALNAQDRAFLAFAEQAHPMLAGCALLMVGEPRRAARLAESVLARRYPPHGSPDVSLQAALREVVRPQPAFFAPPWSTSRRLELVDGDSTTRPVPLLAELRRLPPEQRACLVLGQYAGLGAKAVADVLGTSVATAELDVQQAYQAMASGRPDRLQPGRLAEELRDAALGARPTGEASQHLQHGRQLVRRRRLGRAGVAVAAVLAVVLAAVTFLGGDPVVPQATSTPVPTATSTASPVPRVSASCDIANPSCQATVMRQWRGEMARVAASYLDADGSYFTGYNFSYDPRYETTSFWAGQDGALGLEMFRLRNGATQVYLQVATDYRAAVRCGQTTDQPCASMRFMDGNRFTLSTSTRLARGIEVQHRPDGDQVITVVARNTARGTVLDVSRGDLIALVQDPRLRLPVI